jgi:hypothetical protein
VTSKVCRTVIPHLLSSESFSISCSVNFINIFNTFSVFCMFFFNAQMERGSYLLFRFIWYISTWFSANKAMKHCCKHSECHLCVKAGSWENHQWRQCSKRASTGVFITNLNEFVIRRLCHDSSGLLRASDPIGTGSIPGQCLYDLWWTKVALGQVFLPVLRFFPVHIFPPMCHT